MTDYSSYIAAAYGVTCLVIAWMVAGSVLKYKRACKADDNA